MEKWSTDYKDMDYDTKSLHLGEFSILTLG